MAGAGGRSAVLRPSASGPCRVTRMSQVLTASSGSGQTPVRDDSDPYFSVGNATTIVERAAVAAVAPLDWASNRLHLQSEPDSALQRQCGSD
jgi:hypothetical protein